MKRIHRDVYRLILCSHTGNQKVCNIRASLSYCPELERHQCVLKVNFISFFFKKNPNSDLTFLGRPIVYYIFNVILITWHVSTKGKKSIFTINLGSCSICLSGQWRHSFLSDHIPLPDTTCNRLAQKCAVSFSKCHPSEWGVYGEWLNWNKKSTF